MESPTAEDVVNPPKPAGNVQFVGEPVGRRSSSNLPGDPQNRAAQAETARFGIDTPSAVAVSDPALKISGLYAAIEAGRMPGAVTQQQREARVRATIPGGDKELPSEIKKNHV